MMHDWYYGWGWGGMVLGPLFMIGLVVLVVVAVVYMMRGLGGGDGTQPRSRTPREILDERFAKGEIDREEYESRRALLES